MNLLLQRVKENFISSIEAKEIALKLLPEDIVEAAILMINCLQAGNKILVCGNGGSAADAQHFAAELVNRFLMERQPLPAISLTTDTSILTAIANDYGYDQIFAKQIQALGNRGDVLLAISTSGNAENVVAAVQEAKSQGLKIVGLVGKDGGRVSEILDKSDVEIRVVDESTPRIQEVHGLIIHCLCDIIEQQLFDDKE